MTAVIAMSDVFQPSELNKLFDPDNYDIDKLDTFKMMAAFVKYNQVIEEYTKLVSSDSPFITNFYMKHGFSHVLSLYHWLRRITPLLEQLGCKRILFSKHLQLLWSNVGDLFATVIEGKFIKDAREAYSLVTELHKTDSEFLSSLYFHI